jgi:hypothetical protein
MSQSDCEVVKRQINSSVDATFKTSHVRYISVHANLKCTGLFDEYWRTLAMG